MVIFGSAFASHGKEVRRHLRGLDSGTVVSELKDYQDGDGWRVDYLGSPTPVDSLVYGVCLAVVLGPGAAVFHTATGMQAAMVSDGDSGLL